MGELILKKEVLDKIKKEPKLFGDIADLLGTTVGYGLQLLNTSDPRLTQASVLRLIKSYWPDLQDSDLLIEMQEPLKQPA